VPVTEDTDLEVLALSQNKRFWKLIDTAIERGKKEGFSDLENL
jgi:serine/threonine protein kinase HipA of HipAB toxin-antitoxin module